MRTIICDTRQKPAKTDYITKQIEEIGYRVVRSKLFIGDYQFADAGNIVVDTKQDMGEVESNLIHDHERFKSECIRAKDAGIKLVILIQDPKLKQLSDVFGWFNVRKKWSAKAASGVQLAKMMYTMSERYGVEWQFTTKQNVGKRIVELLGECKT